MTAMEKPAAHGCRQCDAMNLLARYCWYVDHKLWDQWGECFTADGVFDVGGNRVVGRADIVSFVIGSMGKYRLLRHLAHLPFIEFEAAGAATSRSYFEFKALSASGKELVALGAYTDQLVMDGDEWRIRERRVDFDFYTRHGDPWVHEPRE